MKILKFCFVLSFLLNVQSAMATEWLNLYAGSEKSKETHYLDIDSVKEEYNYISSWVRISYPSVQKLSHNNKTYREIKQKWQIQCSNNKFAITQGYYYTSKGDIVDSYTTYANWQDAIPDTVGQAVLQGICWAKDQNRAVLSDLIKIQNQPTTGNK